MVEFSYFASSLAWAKITSGGISKVPGGRAAIFVPPENIQPLISGTREIQVRSGETVSVALSVERGLSR